MDGRTKEYRARLQKELGMLRSTISLRGLADYIFTNFGERDQDELVKCLADPTLQAHIDLRIMFTKRVVGTRTVDGASGGACVDSSWKVGDGLTSNDPHVMDTGEPKEGPSPEDDYWIV